MTSKLSDNSPRKPGDPVSNTQVIVQIIERDGHQFIVVKDISEEEAGSKAEQAIEIPAILLPELQRAVAAIEHNKTDPQLQAQPDSKEITFAHESEGEFARILDFYNIAWEYEPRAFPIEWDEEGYVIRSFTPDFYLPDHDQYVELTTLKQSLVTKKNRKVRRLRELYPNINIKVLYASDLRKLVEKFAASGNWQQQESRPEGEEEQADSNSSS